MLTRLRSFAARRRLTDGQSGYRALSRAAAADAEIVHDYNYAQVLTLDLLAKGHRYAEAPISYRTRRARALVRAPGAVPAPGRARRPARAERLSPRRRGAGTAPGAGPGLVVEGAVAAEAVGGRPGHGEGVVGVVVHEQRLAPERQQGGLRVGPRVERGEMALDAGAQHGVGVAQAGHLDAGDLGAR